MRIFFTPIRLLVFIVAFSLLSTFAYAETGTETSTTPVFSSIKILRDGKVIVTETTVSTTSTTVLPPEKEPDKPQSVQAGSENKDQSAVASSTTTTLAVGPVVVEGQRIENLSRLEEDRLPNTGADFKLYIAIAVLLITTGITSYIKVSRRQKNGQ